MSERSQRNFKSHALLEGPDLFPSQVCGVTQGGSDVIGGEIRVALENFVRRLTLRHQFENHVHRNSCTLETGLARHDSRLGRDLLTHRQHPNPEASTRQGRVQTPLAIWLHYGRVSSRTCGQNTTR